MSAALDFDHDGRVSRAEKAIAGVAAALALTGALALGGLIVGMLGGCHG